MGATRGNRSQTSQRKRLFQLSNRIQSTIKGYMLAPSRRFIVPTMTEGIGLEGAEISPMANSRRLSLTPGTQTRSTLETRMKRLAEFTGPLTLEKPGFGLIHVIGIFPV